MAVAFDPPQARLDEDQRTGHPALFLVRGAPVIHLVGELAELGVQGFQAVGGLEADPQTEIGPADGASASPRGLRPDWGPPTH